MAGKAALTFWDAAGKPTGMHVNTRDLSGAQYDFLEGEVAALATALANISESAQYQTVLSAVTGTGDPDDRGGLRGTKALVRWFSPNEGSSGQYGSNEIGAVDNSLFTVVGGEQVLQGGLYDAIKAAFDTLVETENGNAVEVYEVKLVSRTI